MLAAVLIAVVGAQPVQEAGPRDLEVTVAVTPETPFAGEPIKIRTFVNYTGKDTCVLVDGLKMRSPGVLVTEVRGKTAGDYSRVDRGKDSGPVTHQITLSPGGTYQRHDVLNENLKTGAPVFAKPGTYRLKVRFQGVESKHVTVTVVATEDSESEAVKAIQAGKFHRYWGTIPAKEDFQPEVVEGLKSFLDQHAASRFRPLVAFDLAQYWKRYDETLAAKEAPEEAKSRRERMLTLFGDAAKAPVIATECDVERGILHWKLKNGKSALEFLTAAVEKKDAQEWMMNQAENLLRDVKKKEANEPSVDWTQ